jgi:hypothetical protein
MRTRKRWPGSHVSPLERAREAEFSAATAEGSGRLLHCLVLDAPNQWRCLTLRSPTALGKGGPSQPASAKNLHDPRSAVGARAATTGGAGAVIGDWLPAPSYASIRSEPPLGARQAVATFAQTSQLPAVLHKPPHAAEMATYSCHPRRPVQATKVRKLEGLSALPLLDIL